MSGVDRVGGRVPQDRLGIAGSGGLTSPLAPPAAVVTAVLAAELAALAVHPGLGTLLHAILLVVLVEAAVAGRSRRTPAPLLAALATIPVYRIAALGVVGPDLPPVAWALIPPALALLAVALVLRAVPNPNGEGMPHGAPPDRIGLRAPEQPALALLAVAVGIPAGLVLALGHAPLFGALGLGVVELAAIALVAALAEELLFRGLVQRAIADVAGAAAPAIVLGALAFAATYAGTASVAGVVGVAGLGLVLGWVAHRTRSVWPAVAGHLAAGLTVAIVVPLAA